MALGLLRDSLQNKRQPQVELQLRIFEHAADHSQSMKLLSENGLRPLTYQEALVSMVQNPELKEQLKGKSFYLAGESLQENGAHTIDRTGNLKLGRGDHEQTVCVYSGTGPLSIFVDDDDCALYGERFTLEANTPGDYVAPVVVGVSNAEAIAKSIVSEGRAALRRLRRDSPR